MKNVTVGECKTGKKKKQSSKALEENASLEKKKTKGQKPRKMIPLESEKKWRWKRYNKEILKNNILMKK